MPPIKNRHLLLASGVALLCLAFFKVFWADDTDDLDDDPQRSASPGKTSLSTDSQSSKRVRAKRTAEEDAARGDDYMSEVQLEEARGAFRAAVEKDGAHPVYRRKLVNVLRYLYESAKVKELGPKHDHREEILRHLRWLADNGSAIPGDYDLLLEYSLTRKSAEDDLNLLEDMVKRYPEIGKFAEYQHRVWNVYFGQGDYERIAKDAERYFSNGGSGSRRLHLVLGLTLEKLGDLSGALEQLRIYYNEGQEGGWVLTLAPHIKRIEAKQ